MFYKNVLITLLSKVCQKREGGSAPVPPLATPLFAIVI